MTIPLILEGAFSSKESLHEMIMHRKVCFDHDPFEDPHHLPFGDDPEHHELVGKLHRLCRVFSHRDRIINCGSAMWASSESLRTMSKGDSREGGLPSNETAWV